MNFNEKRKQNYDNRSTNNRYEHQNSGEKRKYDKGRNNHFQDRREGYSKKNLPYNINGCFKNDMRSFQNNDSKYQKGRSSPYKKQSLTGRRSQEGSESKNGWNLPKGEKFTQSYRDNQSSQRDFRQNLNN